MDPFTQAVLGGATAQLFFHRQLGRRAFVMGAVAAALPDFDVVYQIDQWSGWKHHRGITHSIFFPFLAGPLGAYGAWRLRQRKLQKAEQPADPPGLFLSYVWVWVLAMLTHPFLDTMTAYGTQLLAPFSDQRFAVNAMAIIDPVYTLPLAVAGAIALLAPKRWRLITWSSVIALIFSNTFIFYAWTLNKNTEQYAEAQLLTEGIQIRRLTSYPTIFQAYLRRVLVELDDEVRVGYASAWNLSPIRWQSYRPPSSPLIVKVKKSEGGRILHWFSMSRDYYRIEQKNGLIVVEGLDLRYGLPGPVDQSYWGVRAIYDQEGKEIQPTTRFITRPRLNREGIKMLFDAAFGNDESPIFNNVDLRHAYRQ